MGCELTTRADAVELPPGPGTRFLRLLDAGADAAAWRIVELFSTTGAPFEAELGWASGSGSGASARVTVSRATRVSVFARSLRVLASNLSTAPNRVGVTVADGFALSNNHWEVPGEAGVGDVAVPTFADRLLLELSDPDQLPNARLRVYDGAGALRAAHPGDRQPAFGIPVGGAGRVEVTSPVPYRVVFTLSL